MGTILKYVCVSTLEVLNSGQPQSRKTYYPGGSAFVPYEEEKKKLTGLNSYQQNLRKIIQSNTEKSKIYT